MLFDRIGSRQRPIPFGRSVLVLLLFPAFMLINHFPQLRGHHVADRAGAAVLFYVIGCSDRPVLTRVPGSVGGGRSIDRPQSGSAWVILLLTARLPPAALPLA
jgi:MFS transporter, MHS family, proline/betaine transporter